jgi:hypothetical protein
VRAAACAPPVTDVELSRPGQVDTFVDFSSSPLFVSLSPCSPLRCPARIRTRCRAPRSDDSATRAARLSPTTARVVSPLPQLVARVESCHRDSHAQTAHKRRGRQWRDADPLATYSAHLFSGRVCRCWWLHELALALWDVDQVRRRTRSLGALIVVVRHPLLLLLPRLML